MRPKRRRTYGCLPPLSRNFSSSEIFALMAIYFLIPIGISLPHPTTEKEQVVSAKNVASATFLALTTCFCNLSRDFAVLCSDYSTRLLLVCQSGASEEQAKGQNHTKLKVQNRRALNANNKSLAINSGQDCAHIEKSQGESDPDEQAVSW